MNIQVFLTTGSVHEYEQTDPELVSRNLSHISPDRLFQGSTISIGGEHHSTGFPARSVLRVEFTLDRLPDWPRPSNIDDARLIDSEEFRASVGRGADRPKRDTALTAGENFVAFVDLEDAHGAQHYLVLHGKLLAGVARARAIERFLNAPGIYVRRGENTAGVFNPANLVRVSGHPGPPELPASAWLANEVTRT